MFQLPSDYRLLIDALEEPALVVEQGRIRLANRAATKLLGRSIEGRDVRLAIRHPQALECILAARTAVVDVTGIGEAGRSWRLAIANLGNGSAFVRMIDRSAAVSAEKMRVDFVANASHELRTPLSTIIGYAETLADDDGLPPAKRADFSRIIRDEAHRMLRMIEDLMSLSRIEADRFATPTERLRITPIIETAVAHTQHLADRLNCVLELQLPEDLPEVRGDGRQLEQLFENLLTNAVRYGSRSGSGESHGCTVQISAVNNDRFVSITVSDDGPGIAREHLPRLTERFYRVDMGRRRDTGSTGLGLAIVKHIVERHRGILEIKSEVGAGTRVTVQLPKAA